MIMLTLSIQDGDWLLGYGVETVNTPTQTLKRTSNMHFRTGNAAKIMKRNDLCR
jgi:hypothetical protein